MKKSTLLLIILLLVKGSSFSQLLRSQNMRTASIHQKLIAPIQSQASGDTIFWIPLPGYFVNAANAATFIIDTQDVDLLDPNVNSIPENSWGVYSSTDPMDIDSSQGDLDTGYFYAATSWFSSPGMADNWLILGPVTIPSGGAKLTWRVKDLDPNFKDGYEVLSTTTGGSPGNFTNPPLYSVADNDASLDTAWTSQTIMFDSVIFGGQNIWIAFHHNANDQYILLLDNIMLTEETGSATVFNDECPDAIDISSSLGGVIGAEVVSGPYDNDSATTSSQDPTVGFECFGEPDGSASAPSLENTLWFTFTGDGQIYFIESGNCAGVSNYIDNGDTQFALYTGSCGNLVPVACNEDGPNATSTEYPAGFTITTSPGTVYYLMVDGFNFNGALSNGQYCLKITHLPPVFCGDTTITPGVVAQNDTNICFNDTLFVSSSGAVTPTVGNYYGISWVISSADLNATNDPLNDSSFITSYTFTSPAPAVSSHYFINDSTFLPPGTYYWTPVVFGNATATGTPVFLQDLTLDTACTTTGTSIMVHLLAQGDPLCTPTVVNDECPGAVDINSSFGGLPGVQMNAGIFDNTNATHSALDPATGYTCFGEPDGSGSAADSLKLDNTLWFTFTGDGLAYRIETANCAGVTNYINDGDAQMVIYHGVCGNLIPDSCNEDIAPGGTTYEAGFSNFTTVAGTVYYIMIDGFNFNGALSDGEFCLLITRQTGIGVNENIPGKNVSLTAYPSPAKDILNIEFTNAVSSNAVISVTDNIGRTVQSNTIGATQGLNKTSVNVKSLAAGSYMVNVKTNEGSRTVKFIKD